jgi:hypothetical protein
MVASNPSSKATLNLLLSKVREVDQGFVDSFSRVIARRAIDVTSHIPEAVVAEWMIVVGRGIHLRTYPTNQPINDRQGNTIKIKETCNKIILCKISLIRANLILLCTLTHLLHTKTLLHTKIRANLLITQTLALDRIRIENHAILTISCRYRDFLFRVSCDSCLSSR